MSKLTEKREIKLGEEVVILNPDDLRFNDRTIHEFFEQVSGRIDYIGRALADADALYLLREREVESLYLSKFRYWKEEGKSDKVAENYAKADPDVQQGKLVSIAARNNKLLLQHHLQALQAARSQANNRAGFMKFEAGRLNLGTYSHEMDDQVNQIVKDASAYQKR